jgi:hypothetical protein
MRRDILAHWSHRPKRGEGKSAVALPVRPHAICRTLGNAAVVRTDARIGMGSWLNLHGRRIYPIRISLAEVMAILIPANHSVWWGGSRAANGAPPPPRLIRYIRAVESYPETFSQTPQLRQRGMQGGGLPETT